MKLAADLGQFVTSPGFGGLAVLVGGGLAYVTGMRQIREGRVAAAVARTQQNKAVAYLQVVQLVERLGHWAQTVSSPTAQPAGVEPYAPYVVDLSNITNGYSQLLAFGTAELQTLWDLWQQALRQTDSTNQTLLAMRSNAKTYPAGLVDAMRLQARLDGDLRPAEHNARRAFTERVNLELAERKEPGPGRRWARRARS